MTRKEFIELGINNIIDLVLIDQKILINFLSSLNFIDKILFRLRGCILLDYFSIEGLQEKIPFYLFRCEKHGYQIMLPLWIQNDSLLPRVYARQPALVDSYEER